MKCKSLSAILHALAALVFLLACALPGRSASIVWTNTAGGNWSVAANWNPNQAPGASDIAVITNTGTYTVTLDVAPTVKGLTLGATSGSTTQTFAMNGQTFTLDGTATISSRGLFNLNSGTFTGTTNSLINGTIPWTGGLLGGTFTFATNSTLNIAGTSLNDFPNCTLTNFGTVTWTSGLMRGNTGTLIYNYGTWDSQGDLTINAAYGGTVSFFNFGTLRKSAGTNSTVFAGNVGLASSGKVDVQTGVLSLQSGASFTGGTVTNLGGVLQLAAGGVTISNTLTSTNVQLVGGSLAGTNVISGGFTWLGGNLNGATVTIATNTLFVISGGGGLNDLATCTLTNFGTVAWTSGTMRGGASGTVVYNYGLWDSRDDLVINDGYGGVTTFVNVGTLRKSAGTNSTQFQNVGIANTGTVNVQTGVLSLQFGGAYTGGSVTGAGLLQLAGGGFTINGTVTTTNVQFAGGSAVGNNFFQGGITWISGLWNGSTNTIATNCLLEITAGSGNNIDMASAVLTNFGTVAWSSGRLRGGQNGTFIYNFGLWDAQSDQTFNETEYGGSVIFNNPGTLRKSAGATTNQTFFQAVTLNTIGTVDVRNGYLVLTGGGALTGGTATNANGIIQLAGGSFMINGTVTSTNVQFIGGVPVATNNIFQGGITWISGTWNGSTNTVATNSLLEIAAGSGNNIDMASAVLTNFGTVAWSSGRLRGGQNGTFIYNFGLWDAQSDQIYNETEYGGLVSFNNTGTFRKSAGASTNQTFLQGVTLNATGPVNVQSGYLVVSGGGALTGTAITGAGNVQLAGGTFTLSGNVTESGGGQVQMVGGTMDGTNGVMLGNWLWSAGYFAPTARLTLATNSLMTLAGGNFLDLFGALTNGGTMQLQSGTFRPRADQGPGQLFTVPGGLVDVQTDVLIDSFSGGTIVNQGIFRKSGGTNGTAVNPAFFNTGTVDVESSYLSFAGGGSFSTGTVMTGPDIAYLSAGTFTLSGNVNLNNAALNGSVIAGTNGVISGTVTWTSSGSYFAPASTLTIATNGLLVMSAASFEDLFGALTNAGTIQVLGGTFRPRADQGPGVLVNVPGGLMDVKNDVTIDSYSGGTIRNQGIVRKSGGTNTTTFNTPFFNSGTLDAQIGTMSMNGGISLTNGTLNFGISNLTTYGRISIPGAASLTGTVSANLINGYQPIATNTFNVLSYGSETGIFTATNLPFADAWQTNYTPTFFSLEVLNARPTLVSPTNTLTVNELTTLTATNTATDPDIPAQTLTFSLVSPPAGMTIGASSGIITWTPAQTNSPSTNTITAVVTDNGVPPLSASNSFTVIVREVNVAPSLPAIATQTVNELTLLTVTNTATNFNIHATNTGYGLISAPPGMTISTNGIITWTPAQTNSPSTNTVTTVVTNLDAYDLINPNLTSTNSFTVIVREVNVAPVLSAVPNQTVNELTLLTVTNTASEANIHATLAYTLIGPPAGMSITANGIITWTPAQTQSPGTNTITTVVTNTDNFDTVNPHLATTNSFTVVVREVNVAPTLPVIASQTINELTLLTVTNTASETNIHAVTAGYVLLNPPAGASIDVNGIITWTPSQAQSPGTNTITTVVTNTDNFDMVNPHLATTNSFTVVVREVNVAPTLPAVPNQTVNELTLLTVTNTASEANIHAVTAGYVLLNPPAGASISASGIITWTPSQTQSPGTNTITTVVTNTDNFDAVNPHLAATNSFTVVVKEVNVAPTLPIISTQGVYATTLLTVTNTATNSNIHATIAGYGLIVSPTGMVISASGIITWTPSNAQSPSTNTVTTVVTNTDNFDPVNTHLTATNTFTVIVSESNLPPVLSIIGNQTVNELTLLTVTNAATEPNPHATTTGYGLINPPAGAAISTNGVITWTPAQTQDPGTNTITTVVTNTDPFDAVNPHLTATNSFTVVVKEINVAPTFSIVATQTVNELTLLTVTNTAGEANIHATLAYTLVAPPAGMSISTNGIITWTPAQTQSPGTNLITTIVTNTDNFDTVNPHLSATNTFTVIVKEVNVAPVLPVIPTQNVLQAHLLTVTNTATESNIHATLAYTLISPPAGMSISASGIITWTPTQAQSPSTNVITTVVTNTDNFDTVNPHLAATNTFTVIVAPVPVLTNPTWLGGGQFQFTFNAQSGTRYTIRYSTNLGGTNWISALSFDGPGGPVDIVDPNAGSSPYRFYRLKVGP